MSGWAQVVWHSDATVELIQSITIKLCTFLRIPINTVQKCNSFATKDIQRTTKCQINIPMGQFSNQIQIRNPSCATSIRDLHVFRVVLAKLYNHMIRYVLQARNQFLAVCLRFERHELGIPWRIRKECRKSLDITLNRWVSASGPCKPHMTLQVVCS